MAEAVGAGRGGRWSGARTCMMVMTAAEGLCSVSAVLSAVSLEGERPTRATDSCCPPFSLSATCAATSRPVKPVAP